mgnify:CR=1 FL=1
MPYRVDEHLAAWARITAPVLWLEGDRTEPEKWWGHRYPRAEFEQRLATVPQVTRRRLSPCGHMLHFDQPGPMAQALLDFITTAH